MSLYTSVGVNEVKVHMHMIFEEWRSYITIDLYCKLNYAAVQDGNMMNDLAFKGFLLYNLTPKPTIAFAK